MNFDSVAHAMGSLGGAPGADGQASNPIGAFVPLILMFAIFYFLLIRPQQKKAKQHKEMLSTLRKGDYVLTGGGIYGRIQDIDGDVLAIEIADGVRVKVNRSFVSSQTDATGKAKEEAPKEKKDKKD